MPIKSPQVLAIIALTVFAVGVYKYFVPDPEPVREGYDQSTYGGRPESDGDDEPEREHPAERLDAKSSTRRRPRKDAIEQWLDRITAELDAQLNEAGNVSSSSMDSPVCRVCADLHVSQRFACGHLACLRCATAIMFSSRKCPFCRRVMDSPPQKIYI